MTDEDGVDIDINAAATLRRRQSLCLLAA